MNVNRSTEVFIATPSDSRPSQGLVRNHAALVLLGLGTIARLPSAMIFIVLLFRARETTGSYSVAGIASGAYVAARAVSTPSVGRLVDRIGQTGVLVVTAIADAVLLVSFALLPAGTPAIALIAVAAAIGAARPPLNGCVRALIPTVVEASQVRTAFAVESTAFELTFILGPPLALGLASAWSISGSLIVCAILLASGTVLFALQPVSRQWRPVARAARAQGAARSPGVQTFILILTMVGGVFGGVDVALPAAMKALGNTAAAAGPVLGLWGVGSLLGGVLVARRFSGLLDSSKGLITLVLLLGILHSALAGTTASIVAMAVVVTLAGATIAPTYTNIYSAVDRVGPKGTATEAFSWLESAVSGGTAAGATLAGALTQHYGSEKTFLAAGVFAAGAVLVAWARLATISGSHSSQHESASAPNPEPATF